MTRFLGLNVVFIGWSPFFSLCVAASNAAFTGRCGKSGKMGSRKSGSIAEEKSAHLTGGVFENDIGEHRGVGLVRQVRAEADADIERPFDVQVDRRTEL